MALSFFLKFYQLFDISCTCTPVLGHHHYLGLPPPSINCPPIPPPPPGLVPCPSHSPITLGDPKVDSCARMHLFWALPPIPSQFPSTFPLIHGWGAVKHPTHLGPMLLAWHVRPIPTFLWPCYLHSMPTTPPTSADPLLYPLFGG